MVTVEKLAVINVDPEVQADIDRALVGVRDHPEQVRKPAGWGLTQNDRASFVGWNPQPSAVGPVPHQPGFLIESRP